MTENKRFNLDNFDSTREILELLDTQGLIISDMEKEIEELRERVKQLQIDNTVLKKRYDTLIYEKLNNKNNKLYSKPPVWFTQDITLTDKEEGKVAEAIKKDLKERLDKI